MAKFKVYVAEKSYGDYSPERQVVERAGGSLCFARCRSEQDIVEQCSDAEALLLRQTPIGERAFNALARLRVVSRYGAGYDNVDVSAATRAGVLVTVVPDYCVGEVADHTIALLLAAIRHIPARDRLVRNGAWDVTHDRSTHRTANRIYGLVGYGRTAREVRRRLSGFPFRFVACDPHVPDDVFAEDGTRRLDFRRLVLVSHYISLHVPLNAETRHLFDLAVFRSMRRSAILINTSRGPVVNTDDLVTALRRSYLAGAGLDVFEEEPPNWHSPLREQDGVILSDHAAWYSEESQRELQIRTAQEAIRVLSDAAPQHPVNPEVLLRRVDEVPRVVGAAAARSLSKTTV
jgi:D-3-phosphoglycerate dehydrogenase